MVSHLSHTPYLPSEGFSTVSRSAPASRVVDEFESLFVSLMLKSMRSTVKDHGIVQNNTGHDLFTSLLDDQYARQIARQCSFGISDIVMQSLSPAQRDHMQNSGLQRYAPASTPHPRTMQTLASRIARYTPLIQDAAADTGLDTSLIAAVIAQESGGNPHAVSHAGAKGLMQLMDPTARAMGVQRVFDPRENIRGGTGYLSKMLDRFQGDETRALAAYNAGPGAVEKYGGIPPYAETQDYIGKVHAYKTYFDTVYSSQTKDEQ